MLRNRAPVGAPRRTVARRGAINMEYVFAGALVLLIVAALGLAVWHTFIKSPGTVGEVDPQVHLRCRKCNHEYAIDRDNLTKEQMFQEGDPSGIIDDCPSCGTKRAAIQLVKCPKCEKYYLPRWRVTGRYGQKGSNVCEYCKTDVDQWYMDEAKNRKKK